MHLRNSQYAAIMREYDLRQAHDRQVLDDHRREVSLKIPEYDRESEKLNSLCAKQARSAVLSQDWPREQETFRRKAAEIEACMKDLLTGAGFPEDYLDMKYSCPDCHDTGYIGDEKCHCFKDAVVELLYDQSGLKNILSKENFSNFRVDYYSEEIDPQLGISPRENILYIIRKAHGFIDNFDIDCENLLLTGRTGVGKTFLSNCIAKELLDSSHTVISLGSQQLVDILGDSTFNRHENEADNDMAGYVFDCDLLIIDDLGSELNNSFVNSQLQACITRRLEAQVSTIITTNMSLADIRDVYSERIASRLLSNYETLPVIGEDIREKLAFAT